MKNNTKKPNLLARRFTALIDAAESGNLDKVKKLFKAEPRLISFKQEILAFAAWKGQLEVVEFMIGRGAGPTTFIIETCKEKNQLKVAEYLESLGLNRVFYFSNGYGQVFTVMTKNLEKAKANIKSELKRLAKVDPSNKDHYKESLRSLDEWFAEASCLELVEDVVFVSEMA